jgi:hypothetical protein
VTDENNDVVLRVTLTVPALAGRDGNTPVIVLSSAATLSRYVMGINTLSTADTQRLRHGENCFYKISGRGTDNSINFNARAACSRRTMGVYSYFKAKFVKREKGSTIHFNEEDEKIRSKGYFNSTSSEEGNVASCYVNFARMTGSGVTLDSLWYELLNMADHQRQLVAFSVWSFDFI